MRTARVSIFGKGPIEFEGKTLPIAAKHFLDAEYLKGLPEDVHEFLFDLAYAWGRDRKAFSERVLRSCDLMESRIPAPAKPGGWLKRTLRLAPPVGMEREYLQAISIMRDCARCTPTCTWTIKPLPGEIDHHLAQTAAMIRYMEQVQHTEILPPGLLDQMQKNSPQQQLDFIFDIIDGIGSDA